MDTGIDPCRNLTANCSHEVVDMQEVLGPKKYVAEVLIAISLVGLVLNTVTMLVLGRSHKHLNSHYILVFNQCLSDCVICVFTIVDRAVTFSHDFLANDAYLCVMMATAIVRFLSFAVTLFNMIAITVSRFVAVYKPTSYRTVFTRRITAAMIVAMYVAFVVLALLQLAVVSAKHKHRDGRGCVCLVYFAPGGSDVIDWTLTFLFLSLIVLMPCVYTYIVTSVKQNKSRVSGNPKDSAKAQNIVITSFWIVVTFILCFTPFVISKVIQRFGPGVNDKEWRREITVIACYLGLLPMINCIFDPIIYTIRMPKIQRGYTALWRKITCSEGGDGEKGVSPVATRDV